MTRRRMGAIATAGCVLTVAAVLVVTGLVRSPDSTGAGAPQAWSAPVRVPIPTAAVPTAVTSVDPAGRVHVAFTQKRQVATLVPETSETAWTLSEIVRPPGGPWSAPRVVAADRPFPISISGVAANARGDAVVGWSYRGGRRGVALASTRAAGGAWAPEQAVSGVSAGWTSTLVAMDDAGTATVLGRGLGGPGLWTTRHPADGDWAPLALISPDGLGVDAPAMHVSPAGTVDVLALVKRPGRSRTLWSRRANAAGRWAESSSLPGSALARLGSLTTGPDGGTIATWTREARAGSSVLVARRPAAGRWSQPVTLDRTPSPLGLVSVLSGSDGATVVWARWDRRPEDRLVTIRHRRLGEAGMGGVVSRLHLAPVPGSSGARVIYGPPPVAVVASGGSRSVVVWSATAEDRSQSPARAQVAVRDHAGDWTTPQALGTPGRLGYPVAAGATRTGAVVAWAEGPPLSPAGALYTAERTP